MARSGSAKDTLVPAHAPRVLLCRYHFNKLTGHRLIVGRDTISRLTREFNQLRTMPAGTYSCPADFGVLVTARFVYKGAPPDTLQVEEGGCTVVSNGRLHRWAFYPPGPALLGQLLRYTGCPAGGRSSTCP